MFGGFGMTGPCTQHRRIPTTTNNSDQSTYRIGSIIKFVRIQQGHGNDELFFLYELFPFIQIDFIRIKLQC